MTPPSKIPSKQATLRPTEIALLLTDVESSSSLWEKSSSEMAEAIDRLDTELAKIVTTHSGKLIKSKGEGDSAFAVFDDPRSAVMAAVDAQKMLSTEGWATKLPLRVRMGINVGSVLVRNNDYFGETVNRTARLRAAAHGGQVLLSEELWKRIQSEVPDEISFNDLGLRRLKDLTRPERIYQLVHPDLAQAFPPIAALDARSHNLPVQPTEFVGRKNELEAIRNLLRGPTRLLTLTGPAGVGKTRLALQASADLIDEFDHGVWLAMLAEVSDHSLVPNAVAAAMGVKEAPGGSATQALITHLQNQEALLVFDNYEHVLEAAPFVAELLAACPNLKILVTSRSWLNLRAERHMEVEPLPVPDQPERLKDEDAEQYDALVLFEQRVASASPAFRAGEQDVVLMARLCARLEGLPLALELAAAQMRTRGLDQMLVELDSRLKVLVEGPVDLPPRHQALRAAIGWSYDLLTDEQQTLLNRLGVFAGSFDAERAEALTEVRLDSLNPLIQHHLVTTDDERFRLLDTVREFALEKLRDAEEEDSIRMRHFEVFFEPSRRLAEAMGGPQAAESISTFKAWLSDLRAALEWATDNDRRKGVQMAINLHPLWVPVGLISEGRKWLSEFLEDSERFDPATQVAFQHAMGWLALVSGDAVVAKRHLEKAIEMEVHGVPGVAAALRSYLGTVLTMMGDIPGAQRILEEALELKGAPVQPRTLAHIHNGLGIIASMSANYDEAQRHWEKARGYLNEIGDLASLGGLLINLASLAFNQGDLQRAHDVYAESADVARKIGSLPTLAKALNGLGQTATEQGNFGEAEGILAEAVELRREIEDRQGLGFTLMNLAKVHSRKGRGSEAIRMSKQAIELAREIASPQMTASLLLVASEIRMDAGDHGTAAGTLVECMQTLNELNDRRGLAQAMELLAGHISKTSRSSQAFELLGAADNLRDEVGATRMPLDETLIEEIEGEMSESLSAEKAKIAREKGRSMDAADAVDLALREAKAISTNSP